MKLFRIWCEWDIGQEGLVFSTKARARKWARDNENLQEVFEPDMPDLEAVEDQGLIGYLAVDVDPK